MKGRIHGRNLSNLKDKHRYVIKRKSGRIIEEEYMDLFKQYKNDTLV